MLGLFVMLLGFLFGKNSGVDSLLSKMFDSVFKDSIGERGGIYVRRPNPPASLSHHYNNGSRPSTPLPDFQSGSLHDFAKADGFPTDIQFVRAEARGNDRVYYGANGEVAVKHRENSREATRSWVNNNPGNLEYGAFAREHGAIGTDGRHAIFPTVETGFKAQAALLQSGNYRNLTLGQAIARYAPPGENDTADYIRTVENATGINRNRVMADLSGDEMGRLVVAMTGREGWKAGSVMVKEQPATVAKAATPPAPAPT
jgi:hypothetical protein